MTEKSLNDLYNEHYKLTAEINEQKRIEKQRKRYQENEYHRQRTHRLIRKGAMLEKYLDIEHLTIDETELYLKKLASKIKRS